MLTKEKRKNSMMTMNSLNKVWIGPNARKLIESGEREFVLLIMTYAMRECLVFNRSVTWLWKRI